MMDLAMNFDTDECLVTAMFDKGNRNDTMEAIGNIIPFLEGDEDMIGLVCNTIRKLFCMSNEGYEIAKIMGCSVSTTKSRFRLGVNQLKKIMENDYEK